MLEKKQLNQDELKEVNGGAGYGTEWLFSFEYAFTPDFADFQREAGFGYASENEAKIAMEDKIGYLKNGTRENPCSRDVYVRNKKVTSFLFQEF